MSYSSQNQAPQPSLNAPDMWAPGDVGNFARDVDGAPKSKGLSPELARKIANEAYQASTQWLNAGRRVAWADSLRAFQNRHPSGSKYLSRDYAYRSNLFRPKTRAMVRADEAQTAAAFFANEDVVSISPGDADDQFQSASADMMQQLVQYRLTKTIPWFLTLVGARQDGEVQGVAAARVGWTYEEKFSHTEERPKLDEGGMPTGATEEFDVFSKVKDEPFITLLAPENIRIEPGADWRDPVNSSPYVIELIPMYVEDVEAKIESGEWKKVNKSAILGSTDREDDTTRRAREQGRVPGKDADTWKPQAFTICWIRRNIIKWDGEDWHYYSLSSAGELLTDPVPLRQVELHGQRPYVLGYVVLETHKTYPSSKVEITADLQRAANDDWNLRFDNVKLTLNPRQFVKAGHGIEQQDLTRFAPGKVVTVTGKSEEPVGNFVQWDRPPPPDQSAYAEADRINMDWDQLSGSFGMESVQANPAMQQAPATGMHLLSGVASGMNEYELRVFAETWVEPVLRLLVKLEQAYETDTTILALCGRKAQLLQKYGLNHITDELLGQELTTKVNVGIGATNPALKFRNAMELAQGVGRIFGPIAAQKLDFDEVFKEFAGLAGYKDGKRFLRPGPSVQEMQLMQQLQQLQSKQKAGPTGQLPDMSKVEAAKITAQGRVTEQMLSNANDKRSDEMDLQQEIMAEQAENWRTLLKFQQEQQKLAHSHAHEMNMAGAGRMHDVHMADTDRMHEAMKPGGEPKPQNDIPPAHMLAEGRVRTFGNGQRWTMRNGKGVRV